VDGVASDDDQGKAQGQEVSWLVGIALTAGVVAWALVSGAKQKRKRESMLGELRTWLRGEMDTSQGAVWGTHEGIKARFEYATRGTGSAVEHWTYLHADLPPYPLRLFVRRHGWTDQTKIDRGELVDVKVGSEPFDTAFLIEAAPADVVARMFDDEARRYLLAQHVDVELEAKQTSLYLGLRGWITDVHEARAAVDCVVRIARRVREAYAEVEQQTPPQDVGSPYRPQLDDRAARDAAADREAEIANLDHIRSTRRSRSHFTLVMLIVTAVFAAIAITIAKL
jgi:hypothetical protein